RGGARAAGASRTTRGCRRAARDPARGRTRSDGRRLREPWDECARLALVTPVVLAAGAQGLLLRRLDAGDEQDEGEDQPGRRKARPAVRRRDCDKAVREPRQRLEEVVRVARVAPETAAHRLALVRGLEAAQLLVRDVLERRGREPERRADPLDRLE